MNYPNVDWSRTSRAGGYECVYCPDHPKAWKTGYMHTHRIVMELVLGRFLRSDEHVHHKDENKLNNNPSNLELLSRSAHASHHHHKIGETMIEYKCKRCGKMFSRRKGRSGVFCSRRCNALNTQAQGKWLGKPSAHR